MKKIAFTYNSCICMILFLPYFDMYMHGRAWRVCRAFSSVQKKWKRGLNLLGTYLAMAVARAVQKGNSQVLVTFVIEIPFYFWSKN